MKRDKSYLGFVKAIGILSTYDGGMGKEFIFEAEHDIIYSHVEAEKMSKQDLETMLDLGWHVDAETDLVAYYT